MKFSSYIESHHDDLGRGRFVVVLMSLGLGVGAMAYGMTLLVFG